MNIVIIGGGVIGLAIAWELAHKGNDLRITLVERGRLGRGASWAAAGMLAPRAEGLTGELLSLSLRSAELYPCWITNLQRQTGIDCGYWCCGILQPSLDWEHPHYLQGEALQSKQRGLDIAGALWLAEDGQVDNRQLVTALSVGVRSLGVAIKEGTAVYRILTNGTKVSHLETSSGNIKGDRYVLATGAWTESLQPIPVVPRKGQMVSVFDGDRSLQRIIFGDGIYLVPRQDGRIIIGATVEEVGFLEGNTAQGIHHLLKGAMALYPAIAQMPVLETWWGFRPYLADEALSLGRSNYKNLFHALGHYRNGILLAPVTGEILCRDILN